MRPRRFGFTLIELLVVIAVIVILAAILFPVFAKAREQARKATCISNLRQIGIAVRTYTQDYDEAYPNTGDPWLWVGRRFRWPIMPYLGIAQQQNASGFDTQSGTAFDATSYAYSAAFYHSPTQIAAMRIRNLIFQVNDPGPGAICPSQTEAAGAEPARKGMVTEYFNSHQYNTGLPVGIWGTLVSVNEPGADRWSGGRVLCFADGHAKFVQATQQVPSVQDCPDFNLTPDGLGGLDLR